MAIKKSVMTAEKLGIKVISSDMLDHLRNKIDILNQTGEFSMDQELYSNMSEFRIFLNYIKSLKTYSELNKLVKTKDYSQQQHSYLSSFKTGLIFMLNIQDDKKLLSVRDLVTLGRYINKQKDYHSVKIENIIRSWGKYKKEISEAIVMLEDKHPRFLDILKRSDDLTTKVFKYLLMEQEDLGEIIENLRRNEVNYLFDKHHFYKISTDKTENYSTEISSEDIPKYVIATFFEIVYRSNIEDIIQKNIQKNVENQIEIEAIETIAPVDDENDNNYEVINTLDDEDEEEYNDDETSSNSLDEVIDMQVEIPIVNTKKPILTIMQFDEDDDIDEKVKEYKNIWEKMGIETPDSKLKLSITLISLAKGLLNDVGEIPSELRDALTINI